MRRTLLAIFSLLLQLELAASLSSTASAPSTNQKVLDDVKFPRTWVPLASTMELDPDRPTPLAFLGQKYVSYQDNVGQWVILDDACPHRLAPLSEGRIDRENDRLECSYHGWSFNSTGSLQRIPQAMPQVQAAAQASPRSSVSSYPVTVHKNVLWFWPWQEDCLSVVGKTHAHPEGMLERVASNPMTTTRDLPYGWDTLVENLIDPSHVPFAHHGLQGNRDDAVAINMTTPTLEGEKGFSFEWSDRTMKKFRKGEGCFRAPFVVQYDATFDTGSPFQLSAICIPTKPGWARAIIIPGGDAKEKDETTKKSRSSIFSLIPKWLIHILSNKFLDTDLAFLHFQERNLARPGADYFMPAPSRSLHCRLETMDPRIR